MKQDICQLKINNWIACVQDRGKWKEFVEKAKTYNQGVQRLEEEEQNAYKFQSSKTKLVWPCTEDARYQKS